MLYIGQITQWGKVVAIGWVGERYYWMLKNGVVSMMPGSVVENSLKEKVENE